MIEGNDKHDKIMDEYLSTHDVYHDKPWPDNFRLKEYSKYVREQKLNDEDITQEILNMFITKSK